jgi:hypothetical protein
VVVSRRRHRNRLDARIEAGLQAGLEHGRELLGEACAYGLDGVEEGAPAGGDLGEDAAGDDVPGRELG